MKNKLLIALFACLFTFFLLSVASDYLVAGGASAMRSNDFFDGPEAEPCAHADFDCDGFADLAVRVPGESIAGAKHAGAVHVLFGSALGLTSGRSQFLHQNIAGMQESSEGDDWFGEETTIGDFNGDGFSDLAIGVCGEDLGLTKNAGLTHVLYGSPEGLSTEESQVWRQAGVRTNDFFGEDLVAGDFDGDGYDELAIGVPGKDVDGTVNAGITAVLYGSPTGLTADRTQFWCQGNIGAGDGMETNDSFGEELAANDFDDDGYDDLAIGSYGESIDGTLMAGAVSVLYGHPSGLTNQRSQFWHQESPGIADAAEQGDRFGEELASSDFNGDGYADLAIAAFYNVLAGVQDAGAVHILYGSPSGLAAEGSQFLNQNSPGMNEIVEEDDRFGWSLAANDFNGDGFGDLAIGVPKEDLGPLVNCGVVHVIYGSPDGLSSEGIQMWNQNSPGVAGVTKQDDGFGWELASQDFDSDGFADLVVGTPGKDINGMKDAGAITILYGSPEGISAEGSRMMHQDSPGIADQAEPYDAFGLL